jgi:hypothetical protein
MLYELGKLEKQYYRKKSLLSLPNTVQWWTIVRIEDFHL